jgi:hypothetical protein
MTHGVTPGVLPFTAEKSGKNEKNSKAATGAAA